MDVKKTNLTTEDLKSVSGGSEDKITPYEGILELINRGYEQEAKKLYISLFAALTDKQKDLLRIAFFQKFGYWL